MKKQPQKPGQQHDETAQAAAAAAAWMQSFRPRADVWKPKTIQTVDASTQTVALHPCYATHEDMFWLLQQLRMQMQMQAELQQQQMQQQTQLHKALSRLMEYHKVQEQLRRIAVELCKLVRRLQRLLQMQEQQHGIYHQEQQQQQQHEQWPWLPLETFEPGPCISSPPPPPSPSLIASSWHRLSDSTRIPLCDWLGQPRKDPIRVLCPFDGYSEVSVPDNIPLY
jgi:hypothetical protein